MKWFERKLQKPIEKNRPHFKIVRILSLTLAMVVFLAVIAALGAIILPQVVESITTILNNVTTYVNNFEKWIDSFLVKYPDLLTIVGNQIDNIEKAAIEFYKDGKNRFGGEIETAAFDDLTYNSLRLKFGYHDLKDFTFSVRAWDKRFCFDAHFEKDDFGNVTIVKKFVL